MSFYRELYANESLPARARLVYMYLRDRANRDGLCWPAIGTIARETKLSRSTVKRALRDLESCGWLKKQERYRENGSHSSNGYHITVPCCRMNQ